VDYSARLKELGWLDDAAFARRWQGDPAFEAGADLAGRMIDHGLIEAPSRVLEETRVGDLAGIGVEWRGAVAEAEHSILLAEPGHEPRELAAEHRWFSLTPALVAGFAELTAQVAVRTAFGYVLRFGAERWESALRAVPPADDAGQGRE
jgi:hypothetical protein